MAGIGSLSLLTAIARRIAGPYGRRRIGGPDTVLGVHVAGGSQRADMDGLREEVEQLRAEVEELRSRSAELDDVQNRLDFAERMLAQVREKAALPGPKP